jgi:hypothetical protein
MSLLGLRTAVQTRLTAGVAGAVKVYVHGGRFTAEELKRYATQAPCLVVAVLDVLRDELQGSQTHVAVQLGCFIVARDKPQQLRDAVALTLVEAVLAVVRPEETWDDPDASAPEKIRAANLFDGKLDAHGVALWAVTWEQPYDLNVFDPSALAAFTKYDVKYDLKGSLDATVEAEDTVTLTGA